MSSALARLRDRLAAARLFASPRARRRFLLHALLALAVLAAATLLLRRTLGSLSDPEAVRRLVRSFGVWGPVAVVVLQAAQVVLAPVPGQVVAVGAGYVYGPYWGTLYSLVGVTVGSAVAFALGRRFGRPYVETVVHEDALARFDAIDDDHARLALLFVFLVPGLPDDAICFLGGLTRIPLWQLVLVAVVGRAPGFFLSSLVGDLLGTDRLSAVALAVALFLVSAAVYRNRDRLFAVFETDSGKE